jgi:pyruvate dehydrogenase E2 component (dihydrolipoamide acetyltransferase)
LGAVHDEPWAENGLLGVRPVVHASLAADHRATDGLVGARFLEAVADALSKPEDL